jgi:FkbM family methyltransferase
MGIRRAVARAIVRALPSDTGLWRFRKYLPRCPDSGDPLEEKLRGFPLRMRYYPGTYVGWFLYYRGTYEEQCLKLLPKLLRPEMVFVDVGANCGLYAIVAAHCIGPRGKVLAIEPQQRLAGLIEANARLNNLMNIKVAPCAVGAASGKGTLYQPSRTNDGQATLALQVGEPSFGSDVVSIHTLLDLSREYAFESISAMKLDVEGGELRVLEGGAALFDAAPPEFVLVECIDRHMRRFGDSTEKLLNFFLERDYRLRVLYRGRWRAIAGAGDLLKVHHAPDIIALKIGSPAEQRMNAP